MFLAAAQKTGPATALEHSTTGRQSPSPLNSRRETRGEGPRINTQVCINEVHFLTEVDLNDSSRRALLVGLAFLAAALGLIWLVDVRDPRAKNGQAPTRDRAATDLSSTASATDAPSGVALGTNPIQANDNATQSGDGVPVCDDVHNAPVEFNGRLFSCDNTIEPMPIAWRGTRSGNGSAEPAPAVLGQAADSFSRFRLTLFCRLRDLQTSAVQVYFGADTAAELPAIGRDTRVKLQLLGLGPAGQLAARFVSVVARPRIAPMKDATKSDWLATLLNPTAYLRLPQPCRVATWPRLIAASSLSPEALALLPSPPQGAFLQVACTDVRDLEVPVLVYFQRPQRGELLDIAASTWLSLRVLGSADNRVIAAHERIVNGGVAAAADDLRRVFLAPKNQITPQDKSIITRVSMGLPLPETLTADERGANTKPAADGSKVPRLADRKTWLVCAQGPRPPVHVTLFFSAGMQEEMLKIGRGTRLSLRPLGTQDEHILGLFEKIDGNPLQEDVAADDLRRFALQTDTLMHEKLRCQLGRELQRADSSQAPNAARVLFGHPMAEQARLATCVDKLRPFEGQRFLVFWPQSHAIADESAEVGSAIELELAGLVNNVPVAAFVRRLAPLPTAAPFGHGAAVK